MWAERAVLDNQSPGQGWKSCSSHWKLNWHLVHTLFKRLVTLRTDVKNSLSHGL